MAEYRLPHEVLYEIKDSITVEDVIESLLGTQEILREMGPLLEACIPGLIVERIEISIREISESSLRELMWAAVFVSFQQDLEKEVPNLLEHLFGTKIGHEYPTITSILFLLLLFYGVDFVYRRLAKLAEGQRLRVQLDGLIREAAEHCKVSEERLRQILEERYARGHVRSLVRAAFRVFRPSKQHGNVGMRVAGRRIEPSFVADVPSDAQMLDFADPPSTRNLEDVEIELHAQDLDRSKQGWAAVIPSFSKERMRMDLYPPIMPVDIYTRSKIRGDVIVVFRQNAKGDQEPHICHLVRLSDQPAAPPPPSAVEPE
jgi:hypothetical protein